MSFDKLVTTLTLAGIAGLVLVNYKGANTLLATLGKVSGDYVTAVRGPAPAPWA